MRRSVLAVTAIGIVAGLAQTASAAYPPPGPPPSGPPPGFGGTLVADPGGTIGTADPGSDGGGGGGGGGGQGDTGTSPVRVASVISRPLRLNGRRVAIRLSCLGSGQVVLRTYKTKRLVGASSFSCSRAGRGTAYLKLSRRWARKLARRSSWDMLVVIRALRETVFERVRLTTRRAASAHASAGTYWANAAGVCGSPASYPSGFTIEPPPIGTRTPGYDDWVSVRFYVYRYGVGWVKDGGWSDWYALPGSSTGSLLIGFQSYIDFPARVDGWYAGAVAIWWYNAQYWDWNWVRTRRHEFYSFEPDPSGWYCRWTSLPPHNP